MLRIGIRRRNNSRNNIYIFFKNVFTSKICKTEAVKTTVKDVVRNGTREFCGINILEITLNDNIRCSNLAIGPKVEDTTFKEKAKFR